MGVTNVSGVSPARKQCAGRTTSQTAFICACLRQFALDCAGVRFNFGADWRNAQTRGVGVAFALDSEPSQPHQLLQGGTPMVFSLLLMVFGIGALCALMYNAAVYALPGTIGFEAGFWAIHAGAGWIGGIVIGLLAGGFTFAFGQFVLATTRSDIIRIAVVLAFVTPTVIAGYSALLEITAWGIPSAFWCHVFAVVGAIFVGGTALLRLTTPVDEPRLPVRMCRGR